MDTLGEIAAGPPPGQAIPGQEHLSGVNQEVLLEPQEQAISTTGASLETSRAGSQPL